MPYVATIPYADVAYGNSFFADRLRTDAWDTASDADKSKALATATRAIDNLNYAGEKHDTGWSTDGSTPNQPRQFPRGNDTVVPDAIAQACCELALAFLDDVDPNLEVENLQNSSQGIGEARVARDTSYVMEHVRLGIPSLQAYLLLKPFLRDTQNPKIQVKRGN